MQTTQVAPILDVLDTHILHLVRPNNQQHSCHKQLRPLRDKQEEALILVHPDYCIKSKAEDFKEERFPGTKDINHTCVGNLIQPNPPKNRDVWPHISKNSECSVACSTLWGSMFLDPVVSKAFSLNGGYKSTL